MPQISKALRAATAAVLTGGFAVAGAANAIADPTNGGSSADLNPDPSGPAQAKYILFSNGNDLAGSFKASIKDDTLTACGDAGQSPTTWHQGSNANAGSVACGTYQNGAEIIWTTDAKNILSLIHGSNNDVAALYQWWRANG